MKAEGKHAVVFGGARGIGKACALKLLQLGAKVAIVDIAEDLGKMTASEFENEFPEKVIYHKCDVTRQTDVEGAFKHVTHHFGRLQICINTVGVILEKDWEKTMDINYGGCVRITESAKTWMSRDTGDDELPLIYMASESGLQRIPMLPAYTASKHAVVGYMRSVAADRKLNGLDGFRVNAICPYFVDTPMVDNNNSLLADHDWKKIIEYSRQKGNVISPDRVAEGMMMLIEDDSLNGECMVVHHNKGCFLDEATTDKFYSQLL